MVHCDKSASSDRRWFRKLLHRLKFSLFALFDMEEQERLVRELLASPELANIVRRQMASNASSVTSGNTDLNCIILLINSYCSI